MTGPHDDLFDRLHAAADSVPPSTLDLPVVLLTTRRKVVRRRATTWTATVAALAVAGVGVAGSVGGAVLPLPAAGHTVGAAPSGGKVTELFRYNGDVGSVRDTARTVEYEAPDGDVVLDTGLGTGAAGSRVILRITDADPTTSVSGVRIMVGGDEEIAGILDGSSEPDALFEGPASAGWTMVPGREDQRVFVAVEPSGIVGGSGLTLSFGDPALSPADAYYSPFPLEYSSISGGRRVWVALVTDAQPLSVTMGNLVDAEARVLTPEGCSGGCTVSIDPVTGQATSVASTKSGSLP